MRKTNRVILFHRPGLGLSEIRRNEIRNTGAVVKELNDMMTQLEITEPVILVGHSYGGLCVQHFAKEYEEKIAGIVLVDSTSVDLKELDELNLPTLDQDDNDEQWMKRCYSYSFMDQETLKNTLQFSLTENQKQLPLHLQQLIIDFQTKPTMYQAMYSEIANWKKDAEKIKSLGDFPNIPLTVIGRDKEYNITLGVLDGLPEWELRVFEEKWEELITRQGKLNKNSELIFASESTHQIHLDRPDVIIEALHNMRKAIPH